MAATSYNIAQLHTILTPDGPRLFKLRPSLVYVRCFSRCDHSVEYLKCIAQRRFRVILKHSTLYNDIRLPHLFYYNTKIPYYRNILCSLLNTINISRRVKNACDARVGFGVNLALIGGCTTITQDMYESDAFN